MKQIDMLKNKGKKVRLSLKSASRFFMVVILLISALNMSAKEKELYLAISGSVATFYYDDLFSDRAKSGIHTYFPPFNIVTPDETPDRQQVTTVVFDISMSSVHPTSTYLWFNRMKQLTTIVGIENLNTSNVTDMSEMFSGCQSLTSLDLSRFDTSNVTNMGGMFYGCYRLKIDVSNFNTSKVTDMGGMFYECRSISNIDVSKFDTKNVTSMSGMFRNCYSLTSLDLSNFNTSNVEDMYGMFNGCRNLSSLDLSKFDTSNVTSMGEMFSGCESLTNLDVSNFNTANVTDMSDMFCRCKTLTNLDLSKFNTSNVTDMELMFRDCKNLTNLDVSKFNTVNVTNMRHMFYCCENLTNLDVSNFNTANVTNMSNMFHNCKNLLNLDVSNFNTVNVTNMNSMFDDCEKLPYIDVSNFDTSNVTDMEYMFYGCDSLTQITLRNFVTSNTTKMRGMFGGSYKSLLESISIGEKMMQIPSFESHSKLKRIVSYVTEPYAIPSDYFREDIKEHAKLYVPNSTRELYKTTDGWKEFKHIVVKDLEAGNESNSEFKKDDIDENTDLNGNIISNIFFNISDKAGEYNAAEGCIILTKATTEEQVDDVFGKDLFDEYLLNNFTGIIFMLDAGSGTIDLEAETTGEMMLNVKIGKVAQTTKKLNGKTKETIEYNVAEPTLVYVYASIPQAASGAQGMRKVNSTDNVLRIYNIKWGNATGISGKCSVTDSEATIYNLKGQRVKTLGKGLYIVNGKKVIVK